MGWEFERQGAGVRVRKQGRGYNNYELRIINAGIQGREKQELSDQPRDRDHVSLKIYLSFEL